MHVYILTFIIHTCLHNVQLVQSFMHAYGGMWGFVGMPSSSQER